MGHRDEKVKRRTDNIGKRQTETSKTSVQEEGPFPTTTKGANVGGIVSPAGVAAPPAAAAATYWWSDAILDPTSAICGLGGLGCGGCSGGGGGGIVPVHAAPAAEPGGLPDPFGSSRR